MSTGAVGQFLFDICPDRVVLAVPKLFVGLTVLSRIGSRSGWEVGKGLTVIAQSEAMRGMAVAATGARVRQALITLYGGDAAPTVELTRRAQLDSRTSARIRGLAALRVAQGYALGGDGCRRALDEGWEVADSATIRSDVERWVRALTYWRSNGHARDLRVRLPALLRLPMPRGPFDDSLPLPRSH